MRPATAALCGTLALVSGMAAAPAQRGHRYLGGHCGRVTLPPAYLTQDACCGTRGPDCTATTDAYREGLRCALATMTAYGQTDTPDWPTAPPVTSVPTADLSPAPSASAATASAPPTGDVSRETPTPTPPAALEPTPAILPVLYLPFIPRSQRRTAR